MSQELGIDELRGILVACAGGDDIEALHGDISDIPFDELGYDSLALIETAATLKREHGVVIPDEQLTEVSNPGELLSVINERIGS
jgi:act minimal PKS acyl carrier protein